MDGILIFVGFHIESFIRLLTHFRQSGLFSAVVTAFLIASYPGLQPDASAITANLTAQVVTILSRSTNQPEPVTPRLPAPNSYTAYLIINAFWFLSLAFSLTCALAATLVQQWSRTYLQGTEERFNPHQRVRMRTYLQRGVQKFHLTELVDAIPMWANLHICCRLNLTEQLYRLLHIALFLFFCGLIVFLFNIDTTLAHIILIFSIPAFLVYVLLTSIPVFFYDCPYKTPLTFVLSYAAYAIAACRPRRPQHLWDASQWHPGKQTTHLTNMWAQDGREQGAELDHTALRWTLLALTDPNDLELYVKALQTLLQSDSGTDFTRDGGRVAQALLFGPDMLATNIAQLLRSTIPSNTLALAPADRRRLETRAATCLTTISLLARACDGPTPSAYHLWGAWAVSYSNFVMRDTLALCEHPQPAIATLAHSTLFLLAWRALVAYRTFLADIHECAEKAEGPATAEQDRLTSGICYRLPEGVYLVMAMRDAMRGLTGDPASGIGGGAVLAQRAEELAGGALSTHMSGVNSRASELATATQKDMIKAKTCLAVLFMHAACALPVGSAGQDALRALAAPLGWSDSCDYDEDENAMELLDNVRHAHGEGASTVFDVDQVIALYRSIHDTRQRRVDPSGIFVEGPNILMRRRDWRQATL